MKLFSQMIFAIYLALYISASSYAVTNDPINVFVSIPPQKYLVEQIGAGKVSVHVMVRPGLNPETYEPTPKQMATLSESQLYFQIGVPFESIWIDRIEKLNPGLIIVPCCADIVSKDPSKADLDNHIWTSPNNTKYLANLIKDALIEHDPRNKSEYENNHEKLINNLSELDKDISIKLSQLNNRYFIVSHPSWGHFAESYGLKQLSIERDGSEIRAKELTKLIEFAKSRDIKTVYTQKQINNESAKILAREINARLIELDPLAENYIENLRLVATRIAQGAN